MREPDRLDARSWPITPEAIEALEIETTRLAGELANEMRDGRPPGSARDGLVRLPVRGAASRLATLRAVMAEALVSDDAGLVAIGRRVTVREADGATWDVALVLPGDGDPACGWVSGDAPLGCAVLGRRVGDLALVAAPAGTWAVEIVAVE